MQAQQRQEGEPQENFVEAREPAELAMCVILASAYAGLARYCWDGLQRAGNWRLMLSVEGVFITVAALSLTIGLRPYLSPCSLQVSRYGLKYRGPHWPQRITVNWDQVFRLYIAPELIVVLYHPSWAKRGIWPMFIQSIYLGDRDKIGPTITRYSPIESVHLSSPGWQLRMAFFAGFVFFVISVINSLG